MSRLPAAFASLFVALAAVALAGAGRAWFDPLWRAPVPAIVMAAVGIGLIVAAIGWWTSRRELRFAELGIAAGSLMGVALGLFGAWGTTVVLEPCLAVTTATVAASWPVGVCDSPLDLLFIPGYLVTIGVVSVVSLVARYAALEEWGFIHGHGSARTRE